MKLSRILPISSFIILILVGSAALMTRSRAAESDFIVWTASSMTKVRPADTPGQLASVSIAAGRNEYESFQIVVTAGNENLSGVDVSISNFKGSAGGRLSKKNFRVYKVAYINVTQPSNLQGGTGEFPDALIPKVDDYVNEKRNAFPLSVPSGRNQPIWVEVYVPPILTLVDSIS